MPTVRELKNRITFNVDKATVANAENTFSKLKSGAGTIISTVKGVGAAIVGVTALAAKQFIELEKDIGATNFFSRSKEDAEDLLILTKEIAKVSETTSRREGGQAATILSQIPGIEKFRKDLVPILELISVANPQLDFTQVAESFSQLVKDGNLAELKNLLPGSAELIEKLGLTQFNFAERTKTAANRTQLFLEQIQKALPELNRLAEERRKTLGFETEGISKEGSDFLINFGEETAPAMTKLFKEIRLTIKDLNNNKEFWDGVKSAADSVLAAFNLVKSIKTDATKEEKKDFRQETFESLGLGFLPDILDFNVEGLKDRLIDVLPPLPSIPGKQAQPDNLPGVLKEDIGFNLNGRIEVDVKGGATADNDQIATGIARMVNDGIKDKLRNIAAQNGRVVATGGALS